MTVVCGCRFTVALLTKRPVIALRLTLAISPPFDRFGYASQGTYLQGRPPHFSSVNLLDMSRSDGARVRGVEPVYARFGRELKRLRRQRKLSQAALAHRVDPSGQRFGRSTVAMIESGRQRVALHTLLELADALGVKPTTLLPPDRKELPDIAERVRDLPAPEQAWVSAVFAPPARRTRSKISGTSA